MIDYSGMAYPKGQPRIMAKLQKRATLAAEERACRAAVDARDGRQCFFPTCKTPAGELHHLVSRSVRGKTQWVTSDLISSCQTHHRYLTGHLIYTTGNPDRGRVSVHLTALGQQAGIRVPRRVRDGR